MWYQDPHWSTTFIEEVSTASYSIPTLVFKMDEFNCTECCIIFNTSCEIKTPHGSSSHTLLTGKTSVLTGETLSTEWLFFFEN